MKKIRSFFIIKFDGMGIETSMRIDGKEDVKDYKSSNVKSFESGINNIFN